MKLCNRHKCSTAHQVAPGLWQGDAPPPGANYGDFDLVVLTAYEYQPKAAEMNVDVFHAPLDDDPWRPPSMREQAIALGAAREVARRLRKGQRVLVTCAMGLNRSGLVSALALRMQGASGPQAIAAVRRARGENALNNGQFRRLIVGAR
jgi:protein-tyrosine phosphatase